MRTYAIGVFDDNRPGGPIDILWAEGPAVKFKDEAT